METPLSNISLTDEQCDSLLSELHAIGTDCDKYCYGLPIGNKEETDIMRNALRNWIGSLQKIAPVKSTLEELYEQVAKEQVKSVRYNTNFLSFAEIKATKNMYLILKVQKEAEQRLEKLNTKQD